MTPQSGNQVSTSLGNSGLCWIVFAWNRDTVVPAEGNGDLQTLIYVLVARPRRCLTLSNSVLWQNWMAAYLGYTLQMRTLFRGWPIMVNDTHMRRRRIESIANYHNTSEMTDADEVMNPQYFKSDPTDIWSQIVINPKIWIRIRDHFWLKLDTLWRFVLSELSVWRFNNNIIIIIIIISKTMFMVLSSWQSHCESLRGLFDECRTAPSGRRPKTKPDDLGCESARTGC